MVLAATAFEIYVHTKTKTEALCSDREETKEMKINTKMVSNLLSFHFKKKRRRRRGRKREKTKSVVVFPNFFFVVVVIAFCEWSLDFNAERLVFYFFLSFQ